MSTTNVGLKLPIYGISEDENAAANLAAIDAELAATAAVAAYSSAGAIGIKQGRVILTGSSALAMTLAAPVAGNRAGGNDDGKVLVIVATGAAAHTVTTPSNGINGAKHIATFGGAAGDAVELVAYNGVWYATVLTGVTLS